VREMIIKIYELWCGEFNTYDAGGVREKFVLKVIINRRKQN